MSTDSKFATKAKHLQQHPTTTQDLPVIFEEKKFKDVPVLALNSPCLTDFLWFLIKFPAFSLSGKMNIPFFLFSCAVATLNVMPTKNIFEDAKFLDLGCGMFKIFW